MAEIDKSLLKHDALAESVVHTLSRLKQHWKPAALISGAIVIIVIVAVYSSERAVSVPQQASYALASATSRASVEDVANKYPDTFAAAAALVQLGYGSWLQTNYAAARGYYQRVVAEHPNSFLVPAAELAIVKCYVAEGDLDEAERVLKRELLYSPTHYMVPVARIELVHVLMAAGRYDEALEEYQTFEQQTANSFMSSLGDGLREKLMRVTGISTNLYAQSNERSVQ
jgi:predicted negative regulator of RcsB-dependent stress response